MAFTEPRFGPFNNIPRLILLVKTGVERYRLTPLAVCPEVFTQSSRVACDQAIGCLKNRLCGAIILLQPNGFGALKVF